MTHNIALAQYGSFLHGWVLDLPGCVIGGRDLDEITHMLPVVIAEHVAWLRAHGETIAASGAWRVVETIDAETFTTAGGEFCFGAETAPLSRSELEHGIARMDFARRDLLDAVRLLPDVVLDWAPPASAIDTFDSWAPEVRTIREIVGHVLQLEAYYRDGLREGAAAGIFEPVADPTTERDRTLDRLRSLDDSARGRVYHPIRPSRTIAETWTVRKVIRRIIAHERAHAAEIAQRRTWLLLGVPRPRGA